MTDKVTMIYRVVGNYLATSWNTNGSWPIVVEKAQFVAQPLHDVWRQIGVIVNNDHVRGCDGALAHALRHQKEIVHVTPCHRMIENYAWIRILQIVLAFPLCLKGENRTCSCHF